MSLCCPGLPQRRLPPLILRPRVELQLRPQSLHHLDLELVLRRPATRKILRVLLVQILDLRPLVPAQVVRDPRLPALRLAPDPVPHDEAVIRVPLPLNNLVVVELPRKAPRHLRVRQHRLRPQIQLRDTRDLRNVQPRPKRRTPRSADRRHVVVRDRIRIKRSVLPHKRQPVAEVEVAEPRPRILARHLHIGRRIVEVEEPLQKRVYRHRRMSMPAKDDRPLKSKLEVRRRTERKHIRVHIRAVRIRVPLQTPIEEVVPQRPQHPRQSSGTCSGSMRLIRNE